MGKPKMYGMNKPFIKNGRGDRILIKQQQSLCFARGGDKQQRAGEVFKEHLKRISNDRKILEESFVVVAMPRNGGKMAYVIEKALREGGSIGVSSERTKNSILETARIMGVTPPEIVVLKMQTKPVTFAGIIIDYEF